MRKSSLKSSALDQWVTVAEAARLLDVSRPTVYAMIVRGELVAEYGLGRLAVRRDTIHPEATK